MRWLRAHLYLASLIGALLMISLGVLIVVNRSDVEPHPAGLRAWGGVGSNLFDPTSERIERQPFTEVDLYTEVKSGPPFYYAPATNQLPLSQAQNGEGDFDFEAFIALLSAPSGSSADQNEEAAGTDAYSFIPQGLISISASQKSRTPIQQTLFEYGNEAGSYIQSYEERYRAAPQILKDQFEDREDPEKNASLLSLASALEDLGYQLDEIEEPSEIQTAHQKVAASYKELGKKLALVSEAKGDKEMLETILTYNTATEAYVKNFVALATLLSAYGVTFSPDDPGNVFTFTNASF